MQLPHAPETALTKEGGMRQDWYAPREITFNHHTQDWVLENWQTLLNGTWPPEPKETGYTEAAARVQTSPSHHAPFETAEQVIGEHEARLECCGQDGEMVRAFYLYGMPEDRIARLTRCNVSDLPHRMNLALSYSRGWERKRDSYVDWQRKRKYDLKFRITNPTVVIRRLKHPLLTSMPKSA